MGRASRAGVFRADIRYELILFFFLLPFFNKKMLNQLANSHCMGFPEYLGTGHTGRTIAEPRGIVIDKFMRS